jgi:hypothetical protein
MASGLGAIWKENGRKICVSVVVAILRIKLKTTNKKLKIYRHRHFSPLINSSICPSYDGQETRGQFLTT